MWGILMTYSSCSRVRVLQYLPIDRVPRSGYYRNNQLKIKGCNLECMMSCSLGQYEKVIF